MPISDDEFARVPADVLDIDAVATRLGRHAVTVRRMAEAGTIPGAKLGRPWRFWWPSVVLATTGDQHRDDEYAQAEQIMCDAEALAARLRLHKVTVQRLTRDGVIPGEKLGRHWRYWWPSVVREIFGGEHTDDGTVSTSR